MKTFLYLFVLLLFFSCGKNSRKSEPEVFQETITHLTYLDLVNNHRLNLGLKALEYSPIIEEFALSHSFDMAKGKVRFGHSGMKKRCRRLQDELRSTACGEIVAKGQKTAGEVFNAWMNSPDHRRTIENQEYTHTGLGFKEDSQGQMFWTQIFLRLP